MGQEVLPQIAYTEYQGAIIHVLIEQNKDKIPSGYEMAEIQEQLEKNFEAYCNRNYGNGDIEPDDYLQILDEIREEMRVLDSKTTNGDGS